MTFRPSFSRSVGMLKARFSEAYAALRETLVGERKKAGMKQVDVAVALGVHQSLISNIETGERRLDVVEFIAVVRVFGADPAEVLKKIEAACGF